MVDDDVELNLEGSSQEDLKEAIDKLTSVVQNMIDIFKTASADIHTEADADLGKKLDILIKQNQDIAKALLLLLEVQNEHLPKISRQAERSGRRTYSVAPSPRIEPKMQPQKSAPEPAFIPEVKPSPVQVPDSDFFDLPPIRK